MGFVNDIVGGLVWAIFKAIGWMHPVLVILVLALLVAAGSLLVFKRTSNQPAIRKAKGKVKAHLLAVVIFRHDLRTVFKSLGLALVGSLANLRFLVLPLLVMIVPLTLLFVQFEHRLGYRGLSSGEEAMVRVHVREGESLDDVAIGFFMPYRGTVVTPGVRVRDPERGLWEVDFRIRAGESAFGVVRILGGGREEEKTLSRGQDALGVSPRRASAGLLDQVFHPMEPPLPDDGKIVAIDVAYPLAFYDFLGIEWAWWTLFLVFMIAGLFLLRGPLGVQF